jgi:hypothetical protein
MNERTAHHTRKPIRSVSAQCRHKKRTAHYVALCIASALHRTLALSIIRPIASQESLRTKPKGVSVATGGERAAALQRAAKGRQRCNGRRKGGSVLQGTLGVLCEYYMPQVRGAVGVPVVHCHAYRGGADPCSLRLNVCHAKAKSIELTETETARLPLRNCSCTND